MRAETGFKTILFGFVCLSLSACISMGGDIYADAPKHGVTDLHPELAARGNDQPSIASLNICHGYGCSNLTNISMTEAEWQQVAAIFDPLPATGAEEREALRQAMGQIERIVGPKTGTEGDVFGTFVRPFGTSQMDCEDEMLNTGTYLRLLEEEGLIQHHVIAGQAHRGALINGWPHMAVRIQDIETREQFVLDSWFHDNGVPAEAVPIDAWQRGWKP